MELELLIILLMTKVIQFLEEERQHAIAAQNTLLDLQNQSMEVIYQHMSTRRRPRSILSKPRSSFWWENVVLKTFTDDDFVKNFRVDIKTFQNICDMVRHELKPKNQILVPRNPIIVEKQVAVALYKLATCAEMRVVGNAFGISTPSVHRCVRKFVDAMLNHVTDVINMPTSEEAVELSSKFEKSSHIPQLLLIIDGTHIPVLAPKEGGGDFRNRKGWASYNCQLVTDANYMIRDVSCKFPGGSHDAHILKESGFFKNIHNILPKNPKLVNGVNVDYLVIGDPAYPLLPWLLKGYTGKMTPQEESFNSYLNSSRITIEQTIGRLKSRWRILKKTNEMDYRIVPKIVMCCCMLHNIAEKAKISCEASNELNSTGRRRSIANLEQPSPRDMSDEIPSFTACASNIRHALRQVTDSLPLRKQINIIRR